MAECEPRDGSRSHLTGGIVIMESPEGRPLLLMFEEAPGADQRARNTVPEMATRPLGLFVDTGAIDLGTIPGGCIPRGSRRGSSRWLSPSAYAAIIDGLSSVIAVWASAAVVLSSEGGLG